MVFHILFFVLHKMYLNLIYQKTVTETGKTIIQSNSLIKIQERD